MKKLAKLSIFVIGYVVANQIGYLIVQLLANDQQGGYSAYISAFTFFLLPHGLFAVSVITALLPGMSELAVNARWDEFRERLSTGIRSTLLLLLPAAIGYLLLSQEIIGLLLERGVFSARSTELVSSVLRFFVLGLVPFALFQLFLRAFYAMQDTKTPFLINCAAVALNIAVNLPLYAWLGVKGLAAGHALAYTFGAVVQARVVGRRIGGLDGARIRTSAFRIGAAGAGMGAAIWAASELVRGVVGTTGTGAQVTVIVTALVVGVGSYLGLAHIFKVEELAHIRAIVTRRAPGNPQEFDPEGR